MQNNSLQTATSSSNQLKNIHNEISKHNLAENNLLKFT